ncbi:MAG: hypothetical protein WDN26_18970 [Chitinophagaceae bacterium]
MIAVFIITNVQGQTRHSATSQFTSYKGLIMAGYQGWHNTPDDGAGRGWGHYLDNRTRKDFADGNIKIDVWPTVDEYKKDILLLSKMQMEVWRNCQVIMMHLLQMSVLNG